MARMTPAILDWGENLRWGGGSGGGSYQSELMIAVRQKRGSFAEKKGY